MIPKKMGDATLRELQCLVAEVEEQRAQLAALQGEHIGLAVAKEMAV